MQTYGYHSRFNLSFCLSSSALSVTRSLNLKATMTARLKMPNLLGMHMYVYESTYAIAIYVHTYVLQSVFTATT